MSEHPTVFKGNKREVPPSIPVLAWRDRVLEVEQLPDLAQLDWTHPLMEYLSPAELARLRAKALVWREETRKWPEDISVWWEMRMARRRGEMPMSTDVAPSVIDENGVLHCGKCAARWSPHHDGSPHSNRCTLCGSPLLVVEDHRPVRRKKGGPRWLNWLLRR